MMKGNLNILPLVPPQNWPHIIPTSPNISPDIIRTTDGSIRVYQLFFPKTYELSNYRLNQFDDGNRRTSSPWPETVWFGKELLYCCRFPRIYTRLWGKLT